MTKRVFVSIDLPASAKETLRRYQVKGVYWIKWMDVKNFHITVNFLGDLRADQVEAAKEVLARVSANFGKFSLTMTGFEGERDMLWAVFEKDDTLYDLHDQLKDEYRSQRLVKSERRKFEPHILVGKSKTGRVMSWRPEHFQPLNFLVDRVSLYESELTPGSATHTLIQSFPLK